ncbi:hypothetical protein Vretifemale_1456 [Volvox reticuliferus]|uniref:Uncharacterized protein n=1 Tax=Volvox reticuliferus TaxID=1737510 RepID=A0A8J4FH72_9CHLO|nr:hypothetical protein Vretifemale_1456 [Volvox reticuliferus]
MAKDVASISSRAQEGADHDASKAGGSFPVNLGPGSAAMPQYLSSAGYRESPGQRPQCGVTQRTPDTDNEVRNTGGSITGERGSDCGGGLRFFAGISSNDSGPAGDGSASRGGAVHWWNSQVVAIGNLLLPPDRQPCIVNHLDGMVAGAARSDTDDVRETTPSRFHVQGLCTSGHCVPPHYLVKLTGRGTSLRSTQDPCNLRGSRMKPETIYGDRGCYDITVARGGNNSVSALARLAAPAGLMLSLLLQLSPSPRGFSLGTLGRMPDQRNVQEQAGGFSGAVQAPAANAAIYGDEVATRVGLCGPPTATTAVCPRCWAPAEQAWAPRIVESEVPRSDIWQEMALVDSNKHESLEWPQMLLHPTCSSLKPSQCPESSSPCSQDVEESVCLASLASGEAGHAETPCCRASILSAMRTEVSSASKGRTDAAANESPRQLVMAPLSDPIHRLLGDIREIVEPVPWRGAIDSSCADRQPLMIAGHVCSDIRSSGKLPDALLPTEQSKGLRTGALVVSTNARSGSAAGWATFLEMSLVAEGSQAESAGQWDMGCHGTQHSGANTGIQTKRPFFASTVERSEIEDAHAGEWSGEDAGSVLSCSDGSDLDMDEWSVDKDPVNWMPLRQRYSIVSLNVRHCEPRLELACSYMARRMGEDADSIPAGFSNDGSKYDLDASIVESDPLKWIPLRVRYAGSPQNTISAILLHNPAGGRVRLLALAFERRIAELQSSSMPRHQVLMKSARDNVGVSPRVAASAGLCRVFSPVRLSR